MIAFVVAFRDFRDEELLNPVAVLSQSGVDVSVFSNKEGIALGSLGAEVRAKSMDSLDLEKVDGVVFIGGEGALKYLDNQISYDLVQSAIDQNKLLGAICVAPIILAKGGALDGKRATVWSSSLDKSAVKILKREGAEYIDKDVVIDGKIITASGPSVATEFGKGILDLLQSN